MSFRKDLFRSIDFASGERRCRSVPSYGGNRFQTRRIIDRRVHQSETASENCADVNQMFAVQNASCRSCVCFDPVECRCIFQFSYIVCTKNIGEQRPAGHHAEKLIVPYRTAVTESCRSVVRCMTSAVLYEKLRMMHVTDFGHHPAELHRGSVAPVRFPVVDPRFAAVEDPFKPPVFDFLIRSVIF